MPRSNPKKPSPHYRRKLARLLREIDVGLADADAGRVHDAEQIFVELLKVRTPPSLATLQRQARKFSQAKVWRLIREAQRGVRYAGPLPRPNPDVEEEQVYDFIKDDGLTSTSG